MFHRNKKVSQIMKNLEIGYAVYNKQVTLLFLFLAMMHRWGRG